MMTENFPKLITDNEPKIQEAQRISSKINILKSTHRHTIFKLQKIKDTEKLLKDDKEKTSYL